MKRIKKFLYHASPSAGFTLLELLVVISMISVITGFGFASLASYSKQQVLAQAGEDIKQNINLARFSAISSVKPQLVYGGQQCGTSDSLDFYKFNFCMNATCVNNTDPAAYQVVAYCGAKEIVVVEKKLPSTLSFSSDGIDPADLCKSLTFESRSGVSTGIPCNLYLNGNGSNPMSISIDENGNTSIQ